LVAPLRQPEPTPTEMAHARAPQLLERYVVLTREAALGEGAEGGFAGVYPVLKALEESGRVRRGYFVAGLGAAQFAVPGAVDRLRDCREPGSDEGAAPVVLAATDPAQPYGAALPGPETPGRPARATGAFVVLVDGEPAVYLERGAKSLVTFPAAEADGAWADALGGLVKDGRLRAIELTKIDGEPPPTGRGTFGSTGPLATTSPTKATSEDEPAARAARAVDHLRAAGFTDGYRGLTFRA
jgi:ATP-dependent Lhr-like helicase